MIRLKSSTIQRLLYKAELSGIDVYTLCAETAIGTECGNGCEVCSEIAGHVCPICGYDILSYAGELRGRNPTICKLCKTVLYVCGGIGTTAIVTACMLPVSPITELTEDII